MTMPVEIVDSTKDQKFVELFQSPLLWFDSVHYRNVESAGSYLVMELVRSWTYSQWRFRDSDTQLHSLVRRFVGGVAHLPEVERVFWKVEGDRVRVWTIINQPNVYVENQIYDTQLEFMDMFPELSCDFAVIFRQGKALDQISPEGAKQVFSRT